MGFAIRTKGKVCGAGFEDQSLSNDGAGVVWHPRQCGCIRRHCSICRQRVDLCKTKDVSVRLLSISKEKIKSITSTDIMHSVKHLR